MFLSYVTKRGVPLAAREALATTSSFSAPGMSSRVMSGYGSRRFSFSSWSSGDKLLQLQLQLKGWYGNDPDTSSSAYYSSSSSSSSFASPNFDIAVAYQPKDREETNLFKRNNKSKLAAAQSPTGEDNLFVSESTQGYIALGVADGVGGWSEAGYDSSAISRELCSSCKTNFETLESSLDKITPKDLLIKAFDHTLNNPKVEIGGTTACLGILTPDYKLKVANLGDSWCGLFRDYELIQETNFQTHNFNTPYQLAKIPPEIIRQAELNGRKYIIDKPQYSDEYVWDLKKNDIIMFATDGVTDNVIPKDIELFLKDKFDDVKSPDLSGISTSFVSEVVKVSKNPNFPSAFAQELSRLTGQKYLGGKEDDITVIVVKVN